MYQYNGGRKVIKSSVTAHACLSFCNKLGNCCDCRRLYIIIIIPQFITHDSR